MIIGRCIGETSPTEVNFISDEMPQVGEYVCLNYDDKQVLGMIETMVRGNVSLNEDIYNPATVKMITEIEGTESYIKGKVRILGDVNDHLKLPRTPAPPGTPVELANKEILKDVFKVKNPLKLGSLINQKDIDVEVNANSILTRHLAILAMTGAGKSNTVSVLIDGMLDYDVPVFVFDMHGEYKDAEFKNGEVNVIKPSINPRYMSFNEIKKLANISKNAFKQERYFRRAFKKANKLVEEGAASTNNFLMIIKGVLIEMGNDEELSAGEKNDILGVLNKVDDLIEKYANLFDTNRGNILGNIQIGKANVLDLSQTDEYAAEVLVSHILRNSLQRRKNYFNKSSNETLEFPVFFILEEAHILAPKRRESDSKFWIQRVAREGRKFGLGLCLVSQSPKTVDQDALSQMNNMIILRLVEPDDQRHVQSASESLSEDLVKQLPSLNVGEAVLLGLMTKVPTLVKIDEFKGRMYGGDIDVIGEIAKYKKDSKEELKQQEEDLMNLGYDY
ncbi:MAG: ATP-binding protein [Methanobrevibacter sp.]|uniref:helicase HerA-like domain-containing protein n=1 Tax=Methanobrevibacter sp. TaxID=66852 RepID=UPI0026DFB89B|nr:ATP-binding protein [Methanobrevibacter sp.]MDO5849219.1 ATP-binding protein [Methanobrevibacter sp.]